MFESESIIQAAYSAVFVVVVLIAISWSRTPWTESDRSNFFGFMAIATVMHGIIYWPGGGVARYAALLCAVAGLAGVVAYFARATTVGPLLFSLSTVGAIISLIIKLCEPFMR